jgi:hypothetical protein|tara:strand:+ start:1123 stop:2064 length:942 start_codon:yes stop_codon:yes gene_type:complete
MGFLKKIVKKVKKGVSKVFKGVKKVVKKITKNKFLKTLAIVGAALVTGGSALSAFPGLASTKIGSAIIGAGNWVTGLPVLGKAFVPFSKLGAFAGETLYTAGANMGLIKDVDVAAKAIEAAGGASFATTKAALEAGAVTSQQILSQANALQAAAAGSLAPGQFIGGEGYKLLSKEELAKLGTSDILGGSTAQAAKFFGSGTATLGSTATTVAQGGGKLLGSVGSFAGNVIGQTVGSLASGYLAQQVMGEPDPVGQIGPGSGEEYALNKLNDVQVAYRNADIDINDAYRGMDYGTGSFGSLSSNPLFTQQTVGV